MYHFYYAQRKKMFLRLLFRNRTALIKDQSLLTAPLSNGNNKKISKF